METTTQPSDYETATGNTIERETEIAEKQRDGDKTEATSTLKAIALNDTEPVAVAEFDIAQAGNKKRVRKQRLVSYSSQESASSQDETISRSSRRKRTAVNKMGAAMIDHIQTAEGVEK